MKILVVNNYDMEFTLKEWQQDGQAAHQLWGIAEMEQHGIEADILPYKRFSLLKQISKRIKVLGDLDQELRVLILASKYDLIYSGHFFTTALLAFLRRCGIFRTPLVAISFQAPQKTTIGKLFVNLFISGNDKIICLSEGIKDHFEKEFGISSEQLEFIEWGFDVRVHKPRFADSTKLRKEGYLLSTGKTFRDYKTLIQGFAGIDSRLKILGYSDNLLDSLNHLPSQIEVTLPSNVIPKELKQSLRSSGFSSNVKSIDRLLKASEILSLYENAYAVAIPIELPANKSHNTAGLTNLVEAMCMGKATIATENSDMGIDLEKEGIGIQVPLKDADAWKQAIQYLLNHPEETQEMGQRARNLAEKKYNLENFTNKVTQCVKGIS